MESQTSTFISNSTAITAPRSMQEYVTQELSRYRWIMMRLIPDLQRIVYSFFDIIIEAIEDHRRNGPQSLATNRLRGFPRGQHPSLFAVPGISRNTAWYNVPPYIAKAFSRKSARPLVEDFTAAFQLLAAQQKPQQSRQQPLQLLREKHRKSTDLVWSREIPVLTDSDGSEPQGLGRTFFSRFTSTATAAGRSASHWKVYFLMQGGVWNKSLISERFPRLYSWLRRLPICDCSFGYVYFSVLSPGARIAPHFGSSNVKVRVHIPWHPYQTTLMGKEGNEVEIEKVKKESLRWTNCTVTAGGEQRHYIQTKSLQLLAFDESFLHSACNDSASDRVVLVIDVWHPDLLPEAIDKIRSYFNPRRQEGSLAAIPYGPLDGHFTAGSPFNPHLTSAYDTKVETMKMKHQIIFVNMLVLGEEGCGKTSFMYRAIGQELPYPNEITIGTNFKIAVRALGDVQIKLQIWDSNSHERFRKIAISYVRGAHVVFFMIDLADESPAEQVFGHIDRWLQSIEADLDELAATTVVAIVGNKSDLVSAGAGKNRTISPHDDFSAYAKAKRLPYFEISCRTGEGIDPMMHHVIKRAIVLRQLESREIAHIPPRQPSSNCSIS